MPPGPTGARPSRRPEAARWTPEWGKRTSMTGLAISWVTRPPPSGSPWSGRWYRPLTRVSESSNKRGPSRPVDEVGPEVGHVGVDEDDEIAIGGPEGRTHGLSLSPVGRLGGDDPGPGIGHFRRAGRWTRRRPPPPRRRGETPEGSEGGDGWRGPPGRPWRLRCGPECRPRSAGLPCARGASCRRSRLSCERRASGAHRA